MGEEDIPDNTLRIRESIVPEVENVTGDDEKEIEEGEEEEKERGLQYNWRKGTGGNRIKG